MDKFDYLFIGAFLLILLLLLFGVINGAFKIKEEAKIWVSEDYWSDNELAITGYEYNSSTGLFNLIVKNNKDTLVEIEKLSFGDFEQETIFDLNPGQSFSYDIPMDCNGFFSYPVTIDYLENEEEVSFVGEQNFVGKCE